MSLEYIASSDKLILLCGDDTILAEKYQKIFKDDESDVTFDPYTTAAHNIDLIMSRKLNSWTASDKKTPSKRKFGAFDTSKWVRQYVNLRKGFLEETEETDVTKEESFDAYAYFMAYEQDILTLYKDKDELSKMQKSALHYIEMGNLKESVELDYAKYVATYDDIVISTVSNKPDNTIWDDWIVSSGKLHYETSGKENIRSGKRELLDFFDPILYAATYPYAKDLLKDDDGNIDSMKCCVAYITFGASNGLNRNGFVPAIFLANYPEYIKGDILNGDSSICPKKVAKIWLDKIGLDVKLDNFDPFDYKALKELPDELDPYVEFVNEKLDEFKTLLAKEKSWTNFFKRMFTCAKPKADAEELTVVVDEDEPTTTV